MQNGIDFHIDENQILYEQRIQKLEHDKIDLQRRLRGKFDIFVFTFIFSGCAYIRESC